MRDPNRVWEITNQIATDWHSVCPDWRFMQLMVNFLMWYGGDPFYMEDDEFQAKFEEFMLSLNG